MKRLEVVAALLEEDGRVLICQRAEGKARGLLWEFPGGKVEPGETRAQAIERECMEELGVKVRALGEAMDVEHAYPDVIVHLTLMRVEIVCGRVHVLEHRAVCMAPIKELEGFELCPADRAFARMLAQNAGEKT